MAEKKKAKKKFTRREALVCLVLVVVIAVLSVGYYSLNVYGTVNFVRTFSAKSNIDEDGCIKLYKHCYMLKYDSDTDRAALNFSAAVGGAGFRKLDGTKVSYEMDFEGKRVQIVIDEAKESDGYMLAHILEFEQ